MANLIDKPTAGWAAYKAASVNFPGEAHQDEFYAEADVADAAILLAAETFEGVAAKLRRAFIETKHAAWAEKLALGDESARNDLEMSDPYTRMFFGAIEDLERLAARAEWDRALSAYSQAHAAVARRGLTDAECDGVANADNLAFRAMVATPAPDLAALKAKMEIGLANVWADCHAEPEEIAALLADVARLGGEA